MKYLFIVFVVLLFFTSCSSRYYMKRGRIIYETGRYYKAGTKYEKAYNKAKRPEVQVLSAMYTGQCYEDINNIQEAANWYRRAIRADKMSREPYLKMAELNARKGDLEEALSVYAKFDTLFPDDNRGKDGIYNVELIQRNMAIPGRYVAELQKEFNSRNSDFGPVYYPEDNNIVYFASTRKKNSKKKAKTDPITGDDYSHIYVTEYTQEVRSVDKRGNVKIKRYPEPRWLAPRLIPDSIMSSKDEGGMCFAPDGTILYFTSSRTIKGSNSGTRIYKVTKKEDEKTGKQGWMSLAKSGVCGDTVSVGHPALTPDGLRMYFVSDRLPGGFGGKDIWYAEWENGKWGEPHNAGDLINTEKDELFPYVRDNGELYFSSDGHGGMGGLDLYKVTESEGKTRLEHLPSPLNSFADDFGITFKKGTEEGLFTSSRSNRSDNIYAFKFIPQQLRVHVLAINSITENPIRGVNITAVADDGNTFYLETDSAGIAVMEISPDREYAFTAENSRYLKGKGTVSTYREKSDRIYEVNITMQPIEKPIVIPNIYFDLAKWDLRTDAMENLKELLSILNDNPNITIELSAHTDMIGNDKANMELSEKRAQSVVDYLISQGINWDRLEAKGYGKNHPRQINEKDAKQYSFLKPGDILNERFIRQLKGAQREDAMQLNRRIEFKVLNTNYRPGPNSKQKPGRTGSNTPKEQVQKETQMVGQTQIRELSAVKGKFYTVQLGVFSKVPGFISDYKVVFTEPVKKGVRYCTGIYDTREEAAAAVEIIKKKGRDCFVIERNNK